MDDAIRVIVIAAAAVIVVTALVSIVVSHHISGFFRTIEREAHEEANRQPDSGINAGTVPPERQENQP